MLPRGRYSSNEWDWETIDSTMPNELVADSCGPFRLCEKDSRERRGTEQRVREISSSSVTSHLLAVWGLHLSLPQGI